MQAYESLLRSYDRPKPTVLVSVNLLWLSVAILAAGAVLRISGIETQSLWTDDGFSIEYSTCDRLVACVQHMTSADTSERFNILYFLILHLWRDVLGDSTLSLRALSVTASILVLPVIWCAAAKLFGRRNATWSLAFSATSAFALFYAHEVRPYALLVLISALQLWSLARSPRRGRERMFQNTLHRRVACRLLGKYLLAIIHYSPGYWRSLLADGGSMD